MVSSIEWVALTLVEVIAIVSPIAIYARRYKRVGPNQAMVVWGRRMMDDSGMIIIKGGGKFIIPIIEQYGLLSLNARALELRLDDAVIDSAGRPRRATLEANTVIRISDEPERLPSAARQLLGKTDQEVDDLARSVIEGNLRQVMAGATFEDLNRNWEGAAATMGLAVRKDLEGLGLELESLTIKELTLKG